MPISCVAPRQRNRLEVSVTHCILRQDHVLRLKLPCTNFHLAELDRAQRAHEHLSQRQIAKPRRADPTDAWTDAPTRDILGLSIIGLDREDPSDARLIAARGALYRWVLVSLNQHSNSAIVQFSPHGGSHVHCPATDPLFVRDSRLHKPFCGIAINPLKPQPARYQILTVSHECSTANCGQRLLQLSELTL